MAMLRSVEDIAEKFREGKRIVLGEPIKKYCVIADGLEELAYIVYTLSHACHSIGYRARVMNPKSKMMQTVIAEYPSWKVFHYNRDATNGNHVEFEIYNVNYYTEFLDWNYGEFLVTNKHFWKTLARFIESRDDGVLLTGDSTIGLHTFIREAYDAGMQRENCELDSLFEELQCKVGEK